MFHYYFNLLVFQFRVISEEYFLDECSVWEINDLIENIKYLDRNLWESTRLNSYIVAKANFKNVNKINDIFPLPWDNGEDITEDRTKITDEEIQQLKELEKLWAD